MKPICFTILSLCLGFHGIVVAQKPLSLNEELLRESFLLHKKVILMDTIKMDYHFKSTWHFERAYNSKIIDELLGVLKVIESPSELSETNSIRFVKCYFTTEAFARWYIILFDQKNEYYYFTYKDNSGLEKIPLVGKAKNEDFIWKAANLLFDTRSEKNDDYFVFAEIKENEFTVFNASQTFHFSDTALFSMLLELIVMKDCE